MTRKYRVRKNSTRQPKVRHANRWPGLHPYQREAMAKLSRLSGSAVLIDYPLT